MSVRKQSNKSRKSAVQVQPKRSKHEAIVRQCEDAESAIYFGILELAEGLKSLYALRGEEVCDDCLAHNLANIVNENKAEAFDALGLNPDEHGILGDLLSMSTPDGHVSPVSVGAVRSVVDGAQ